MRDMHNGIKADIMGDNLTQGGNDTTGLRRHTGVLVREAHAKGAGRSVASAFNIWS